MHCGTAFSAFVLSQIGASDANVGTANNSGSLKVESKVYAAMNDKEKELVKLDWSDFTISDVTAESGASGAGYGDRQTRRS